MRRSEKLLELLIRHTPETNHTTTKVMFEKVAFEKDEPKMIDPIVRYMECLQVHREYLEFFQIGVVRDQRTKIQQVAKYVGLAMPDVPMFLDMGEAEGKQKTEKNKLDLTRIKALKQKNDES